MQQLEFWKRRSGLTMLCSVAVFIGFEGSHIEGWFLPHGVMGLEPTSLSAWQLEPAKLLSAPATKLASLWVDRQSLSRLGCSNGLRNEEPIIEPVVPCLADGDQQQSVSPRSAVAAGAHSLHSSYDPPLGPFCRVHRHDHLYNDVICIKRYGLLQVHFGT